MKKEYQGKFIVLEGGPGSGKSVQHEKIIEMGGWKGFREPGGTLYGELVREVLQERHDLNISPNASLFGYMTCRANLVDTEIRPMLEKGTNIALDRYWPSTYAYQGAEGISRVNIMAMVGIVTGDLVYPDLFIFYNVDPKIGQERKNKNKQQQDRYDVKKLDFQKRVRENYFELMTMDEESKKRWVVIDANGTIEEVHEATVDVLRRRKLIE